MSEELSFHGKRVGEPEAGEGSLERSERSERSGSEPSPAAARPEGEPQRPAGSLAPPAAAAAGQPGPAWSDEAWEDPAPPRHQARPERDVEPEEPERDDWEVTPQPPNLSARRRGTLSKPHRPSMTISPQQKVLLLDTWQRSGLPARDFAALVNVSHHTLYAWKKRFEELGPAGLMDRPKGGPKGSRLPELTKRTILMLKQAHPDWGCQRISDMLTRGPALPASPAAIARVLHEAGYEMEERPTRPHPPQVRSFERAKPNQLWQTDLFTFMLKRQNRRVYLVAFMDDHSRFITGYGLHASQSAPLVLEVLRAAIAACGTPAEILTDNGSQYITWRGKSQFTRELEKRGIRQIVARPRRPQTLGKIERFWGSLWRECLETAVFLDLAEARQRIGLWIDHYNLQRPHQGIEGLVPADRFFHAAPEVLKTLKQRVAENARELARHGVPKKPFYLTGQVEGRPFSVHREGDRVILHQADAEREEIDLKRPRHEQFEQLPAGEAPAELPPTLCADGSPASLWQHRSREDAPGTSPMDVFRHLAAAPEAPEGHTEGRPQDAPQEPSSKPSDTEGGQP
jgi:transposase InsO family protein